MKKAATLLIAFFVTTVGALQAQMELPKNQQAFILHDSALTLIKNVRVIDGTGARAQTAQDVLLKDGKIAAVVATGSHPHTPDTIVIDGSGKSLMPGLVMVHEHLFYPDHRTKGYGNYMSEALNFSALYLSHGVTTMRTGGTMNITDDIALKKLVAAGRFLGPDIHLTAPYINGPGGFSYQMPVFESPEKVRAFVRYWASQGVTSLKAYMDVSRKVLGAAIDEAHKQGMHVTGHLCSVTYSEAADLGIDDFEHGFNAATDFVSDKKADVCPSGRTAAKGRVDAAANLAIAQPLFDKLIAKNIRVTSTLAVFAAGLRDYEPSLLATALMAPDAVKNAERVHHRFDSDPQGRDRRETNLQAAMKLERAFASAGGTLVVGTDPTGWGGTIPGPGNHAALFLLEEAGFSPLEVITIATKNGAEFLGVSDTAGTITTGKTANLILVDGKPDENLRDLSNISAVFKNGVVIDGLALAASLKGTVGR